MDNLIEEIKEINKDNDIFGTYQKSKSICDFFWLLYSDALNIKGTCSISISNIKFAEFPKMFSFITLAL